MVMPCKVQANPACGQKSKVNDMLTASIWAKNSKGRVLSMRKGVTEESEALTYPLEHLSALTHSNLLVPAINMPILPDQSVPFSTGIGNL